MPKRVYLKSGKYQQEYACKLSMTIEMGDEELPVEPTVGEQWNPITKLERLRIERNPGEVRITEEDREICRGYYKSDAINNRK